MAKNQSELRVYHGERCVMHLTPERDGLKLFKSESDSFPRLKDMSVTWLLNTKAVNRQFKHIAKVRRFEGTSHCGDKFNMMGFINSIQPETQRTWSVDWSLSGIP